MKYKLGYDYYWCIEEDIEWKGEPISGISIDVLFDTVFTCSEEEKDNPEYWMDKPLGHHNKEPYYLYDLVTPQYTRGAKRIDFVPNFELITKQKDLSFKITEYQVWVYREMPQELQELTNQIPEEKKRVRHTGYSESVTLTEEEFFDLLDKYTFHSLQTSSYFTEEVPQED